MEQIFPFLDVRFVAVNDGFDTLTAERSQDGYIVPLKNIMNEVYSRDISRKVSSALEVKQQRGEFIGSWPPYSYRKSAEDKHRLEPDPETAPVLKDIFKWRLSGMGYLPIVRRLNELGIPSPSRLHSISSRAVRSRRLHPSPNPLSRGNSSSPPIMSGRSPPAVPPQWSLSPTPYLPASPSRSGSPTDTRNKWPAGPAYR